MRFQDALLLQKQQAEQEERLSEAQRRLEQAAASVDDNFKYCLQRCDPFEESYRRIMNLQKQVTGQSDASESLPSGSTRSVKHYNGSSPELTIRHLNEATDLDSTSFNLFRKLKYGE